MALKTTKQPAQKFGLCLDWETSGADWGRVSQSIAKYQGLTFGAIVFDATTFEPVAELYVEIKFNAEKYQWDMGAEKIHGKTREYLEANGVSQEEAATQLAELILKYWGPDTPVMFLGHNAEFDINFTAQLLSTIEIEFGKERADPPKFESWIRLHHVILDTSPMGFIAFGLYKSDLLFKRVGFEDRGDHNALQDARQTLEAAAVVRHMVRIAEAEMAAT